MKYSNQRSLGKLERERLAALLRACGPSISTPEASQILGLSAGKTRRLLFSLAKKGWLSRLQRGLYIPVPLESESCDIVPEEPFVIAEKLFAPCYITGWSAASYWGLTEQIFNSIVVMTQQKRSRYQLTLKNTQYLLHLAKPDVFFGLKTIWKNNVKIQISDPTRTIIDLINNPKLGGGIRTTVDILRNYFSSSFKSSELLEEYLQRLDNGAAYKRAGFLIEKFFPEESKLTDQCKIKLTTGNAKLDSSLECNKLITKWRLWVPENWK